MSENSNAVATEESAKTVIRPKLENYVKAKSASGKRSHRTDDFVARTLANGKSLEEIKSAARHVGIDVDKWSELNIGQQRMLIGNKLRRLLTQAKDPISEAAVTAVFGEPVAPYDAEAAAAAKAAREAEQAEKKAAKAAAAENGETPAKPPRKKKAAEPASE